MNRNENELAARFGEYGGRYIPEVLAEAHDELEREYIKLRQDPDFRNELTSLLTHYAGRPTPLTLASRLSSEIGGARIWLKREDLAHTGAHKLITHLGRPYLRSELGNQESLQKLEPVNMGSQLRLSARCWV